MSSRPTSTSSPTMTSRPLYRDTQFSRLPNALAAFLAVGVAIAVGAIYGDGVRNLLLALGLIAVGVIAVRTRLIVTIEPDALRAGPAHIEWRWVERVEVLEGAAMRAALTVEGHPHDYLQLRSTGAGLRAWLRDPSDPHRLWLISVRHPQQVRDALSQLGLLADAA